MLKLTIKPKEMFNEEDSSFVTTPAVGPLLDLLLLGVPLLHVPHEQALTQQLLGPAA